MNVLFNRPDDDTSKEIKELLGFIDVDIKYNKIKSDVFTATRELIEIVGRDIYNIAFIDYSTKTDEKKELVRYMRYPIIINAYRMFAPNLDIAHTINGRKMRQDENQKQAFEWMIDRDNEALERKYYRALDDLLHYLDEEVEEWKASEAYEKLQESVFKTTNEFDEHFPISSRLLLSKLQPGIKQCLRVELTQRIGSELLNTLLKDEIAPEHQALYYEVKQACAYYALSWAMPRLSIQLFPQGILQAYVSDQSTTQSRQVAGGASLAYAKQYFEKDFDRAIGNIETILKASEPFEEPKDDFIVGCNYVST